MGRILLPSPENRFNREAFELFDDFNIYVKDDLWTDIQTDSTATVTSADGMHSVVKLLTSADNESAVFYSVYEIFKLIANTPLYAETRFLFTDGAVATFNACLVFGFTDAWALDIAVDGGQSVAIADTGALVYKLSEGQAWCFATNVAGGTQADSTSTAVPQSSSYQTVKIDCVPRSATVFECRPFVDGKQLIDSTSGDPIMHTVTLGTSVDMQIGWEIKGGHADDTSLWVDYIYASQGRTA